MERKFLLWGFIFGGLAVIIGAFGAHALKEILTENQQASFDTGIRYQMYHSLLLLFLSTQDKLKSKLLLNFLVIGTLLFSFSIYLLNLRSFLGADWLRFLGPITPLGGLLLILAWFIAAFKTIQNKMN
ncbi:MAG: uncharacterized membrane protein YgdD (TMEM256/DUF423 family) [Vicingaceae bacterium]|jgi:uncharacterized membrane protein YgdD (TMEM256/DUF423 family)